jgi:hypothetical protein
VLATAGNRRYAFVFVVQQGDLELKSLLLAASLRKFLRCDYELIGAVPVPTEEWGAPAERTVAALRDLNVRMVPITNPFKENYPIGNKLSCLSIPTDADKIVFVDSDIVALREFADEDRFGLPFNAKPADLQTFSCEEETWRAVYEAAQVSFPSIRLLSTISKEFAPPYFNSGFIAVDSGIEFGKVWLECCQRIYELDQIPNKRFVDQIGLPVAVSQLGLTFDCLDERYNYPAHLKPLGCDELPYFCHYHTVNVLAREPALRDLLQTLASEHSDIRDALEANVTWHSALGSGNRSGGLRTTSPSRSPVSVHTRSDSLPTLVITGIPRSGTSYLCNVLHNYSNCVVLNEPSEIFDPLANSAVAWKIARFYSQIRSDIWWKKGIANKLRSGTVTQDTAGRHEVSRYSPEVDSYDFVLGTKNTLAYLARLDALQRVLPQARIVVCVRNPFDTIASWKATFPHLREVNLQKLPVGHPNDRCLTGWQKEALQVILDTEDLAQRRAVWWNYLAERILERGRSVMIVRYPQLVMEPEAVAEEIFRDWPKGNLRNPIESSDVRQRRNELEEADKQAIRAICSQTAAELGLADDAEN